MLDNPKTTATRSRQSAFDQEQANRLLEKIAVTPKGLRAICKGEGMPTVSAVMAWLGENKDFAEHYARVKREQVELLVDDMLEIADDGRNDTFEDADGNEHVDTDVIQRSKLRVDTRKWLAAKLMPKKYGDKVELEHSGGTASTLTVISDQRRAELRSKKQQAIAHRRQAPALSTNGNGKNGHN